MSYYYDEPYEYDDFYMDQRAGYEEALYEEGLQMCWTCEKTHELDTECPSCIRRREVEEGIANAHGDLDAMCYGCGMQVSETRFMGQRVCIACYKAIANGQVREDRLVFADPGGNSALRAAGPGNPRIHPCPSCYEPNRLTPQDIARGYQCDACADRAERGGW